NRSSPNVLKRKVGLPLSGRNLFCACDGAFWASNVTGLKAHTPKVTSAKKARIKSLLPGRLLTRIGQLTVATNGHMASPPNTSSKQNRELIQVLEGAGVRVLQDIVRSPSRTRRTTSSSV